MIRATMIYTIPIMKHPIIAPPVPSDALAAIIGAMKAKEDPRYAGTCHFVKIRKRIVAIPLDISAIAGLNPTKNRY